MHSIPIFSASDLANGVIGGLAELDDFIEATYSGFGLTNLITGEFYNFSNVLITAVVPAPSTLSLIGVGFFAARRRRVG